ncbi:MAG TPA: hypothetical protein VGZ03_00690 [Acidimicrobiales bacterium]|nr:hypothetical protein [Acidimicrobiales bacterium]
MRSTRRGLVTWCVVALVTSSGVAASAAGAPPRSIVAASPNRILAASMAAARGQHSVHATEVEHIGRQVVVQRDDSNERSGLQQLVLSTGATVDIRLFPTVLYLKANAKGIRLVFHVRDDKVVNRWVMVRRSNGAYKTLAAGIDFPSLLAQMPPSGRLAKSKVTVVGRHRVIAISGRPNQVAQHVDGTESFDVSTKAPFLPPRISGHLTSNRRSATLVITFSLWGRNFVIQPPHRAIPISKTSLL